MTRLGRALGAGRLFRLPGNPMWVLDWKDGRGQRRRQALSTDKRAAERLRSDIINNRDMELAGLGAEQGQGRPWSEIVAPYLADLRHRAGEKHTVNVEARLGFMLRALRVQRVRDIQATDLTKYAASQLRLGKSNRTINTHIGALRAALNWAVRAGLIAQNPIKNVAPLPSGEQHQRHVRRALSDLEIEAFLTAAGADDEEQAARVAAETTIAKGWKGEPYAERRRPVRVPQVALWRTLLETGARWGELTSTTWADLDRERLTLRLRAATTKSGRSRIIPLRAELVAELWALRSVHQRARQRLVRATDSIFTSPEGADWARDTTNVRRMLYRVLDDAGIPRRTSDGLIDIHALRHTAASRMARHGVPLVIAARVLGHATTEMTSRVYVHTTTEDLRQAVGETRRGETTRSA